jgi:hypothetical protein
MISPPLRRLVVILGLVAGIALFPSLALAGTEAPPADPPEHDVVTGEHGATIDPNG